MQLRAKVSDKIQLIENLMEKVNSMIIAGGMAFTFKKAVENVKVSFQAFIIAHIDVLL